MPRPRKDSSLPPVDAQAFTGRVAELGERLRNTWAAASREAGLDGEGTQGLARRLSVSPTLASRLKKALAQSEPAAFVFHLPGPDPLRKVAAGLQRAGTSSDAVVAFREALEDLDQWIDREFGDLKAFHAALCGLVPGSLKALLGRERQIMSRSLAETDGVEIRASSFSVIYQPVGSDAVRTARLVSTLGVKRWRPGTEFAIEMYPPPLGEEGPGLMGFSGQRFADSGLQALRNDDLCEDPAGPLERAQYGDVVRFRLAPTGLGAAGSVDLRLGEMDERPIRFRGPTAGWSVGVSSLMTYPASSFTIEVVCPRDFLGGGPPAPVSYSTLSEGPARFAGDPSHQAHLRSTAEQVESLDLDDPALSSRKLPRQGEFLLRGLRALGADPAEYQVHRIQMAHPFPWIQTFLSWIHPDTPESLVSPRQELYL